jgi:hypothetical protein
MKRVDEMKHSIQFGKLSAGAPASTARLRSGIRLIGIAAMSGALLMGCAFEQSQPESMLESTRAGSVSANGVGANSAALEFESVEAPATNPTPSNGVQAPGALAGGANANAVREVGKTTEGATFLAPGTTRAGDPDPFPLTPGPRPPDERHKPEAVSGTGGAKE